MPSLVAGERCVHSTFAHVLWCLMNLCVLLNSLCLELVKASFVGWRGGPEITDFSFPNRITFVESVDGIEIKARN